MTREATRARQVNTPAPVTSSWVRVKIETVSPLTVNFRGTVVPGIPIAGFTYTVGSFAEAVYQEPSVRAVFPTQ